MFLDSFRRKLFFSKFILEIINKKTKTDFETYFKSIHKKLVDLLEKIDSTNCLNQCQLRRKKLDAYFYTFKQENQPMALDTKVFLDIMLI